MKETILDLQTHSMHGNIIFFNIPENLLHNPILVTEQKTDIDPSLPNLNI